MNAPIRTLLFLAFIIGTVVLQIFLSKKENKWLGLILPAISLIFASLFPLNMVIPPEGITSSFVLKMIITFILGNIPTVILLGIYFGCRVKERRKKQLDKMNIQDLN